MARDVVLHGEKPGRKLEGTRKRVRACPVTSNLENAQLAWRHGLPVTFLGEYLGSSLCESMATPRRG